jgi:hypothetical protein
LAGARKNCRAKLAAAVWMDGCWAMLDAGWTLAGASIVANKISDPTSSSESYHYLPKVVDHTAALILLFPATGRYHTVFLLFCIFFA